MYVNQDPELIHLSGKALDVVAVAESRGYQVPQGYTAANRVATEATKIATGPVFHPGTAPTDPKKVAAWITATAQARLQDREARTVAADLADQMTRAAMTAALAAVPGYVEAVIKDFEAHLADFTRLIGQAPHSVSSHMSSTQFETHAELLRAAENLTAAAVDRSRLGLAVGEGEEIGQDGLWLVLDPHPSAYVGQVTAALSAFRGRLPVTLDEWERVASLGLRMAGPGDVATRKERHSAANYANGTGADAGMVDKTYADVLGAAVAS